MSLRYHNRFFLISLCSLECTIAGFIALEGAPIWCCVLFLGIQQLRKPDTTITNFIPGTTAWH